MKGVLFYGSDRKKSIFPFFPLYRQLFAIVCQVVRVLFVCGNERIITQANGK